MNNKNKIGLIAVLAGCVVGNVMAGDLTSYASGDVLICFRNPGSGLELVVDAGPVSTFIGYSVNSSNNISAYSSAQLTAIGGVNSCSWSAFTWQANNTLYVTKPRGTNSLNFQTIPYLQKSSDNQNNTVIRMASIPVGAKGNYGNGYNSGSSTPTAVIEESFSTGNLNYSLGGTSYRDALFGATGGKFNNTFQANPENTTLANFSTAGKNVRSDFYQISPGNGVTSATLLGYFELHPNGTMSYVAYPSDQPKVKSLSRAGNVSTITYSAGVYGTYTLKATSDLTTPKSSWSTIQTLTSGDTDDHTATDTTSAPNRFYIINAQ